MAAKISSRDHVLGQREGKAGIPKDVGGRARYIGVIPKYLAMGSWNPSKKRRVSNG